LLTRFRHLLPRVLPGGAILCFHSVTTPELPADGIAHLPLDQFATAIRTARRLGEFVPLSELVRRQHQGRSTSGLLAITLDDAYAALCADFQDFISREQLPVAIFVVGNATSDGERFWWDRIDDAFARAASDRWRTFEDACGLPDAYRRGQPREFGPLRPLRQWLLTAYAGRWPDHLEPELRRLEDETSHLTSHRAMTFDELAALAARSPVEIGVHTATHPVLPLLSDTEQLEEISTGYRVLRERFAQTLPILSIPFGLYDARTLRAASAAGMTASLTLEGRPLDPSDDRALPRFCLTRNGTALGLALNLLRFRTPAGARPIAYPALPSATT